MKRIAYYLRTAGFGGVELGFLALLRHLDRQAFAPVVYFRCTDQACDSRMRTHLKQLDIPIVELDQDGLPLASAGFLPTQKFPPEQAVVSRTGLLKRLMLRVTPKPVRQFRFYRARAEQAAEVFRQGAFDIIHFLHGIYPSYEVLVIASWLAKIPVRISDVHGGPKAAPMGPWIKRYLVSAAARSATHVRALSRTMSTELQQHFRIPNSKIRMIENGIDLGLFADRNGAEVLKQALGLLACCCLVTTIQRLCPEKGLRVMIDAIGLLRDEYPDTRYLVVGDGPLREELQERARARRVESQLLFLGFREDIPNLLSASDLVVLPSLSDAFPRVLLEAMAAGKPVIATNVGGVSEILGDGAVGTLVEPGDAAELARALKQMLSNESSELRRLGADCRRRVETHYTEQTMVDRLLAIYREYERTA